MSATRSLEADVAIVGAGPAGSVLAALLAGRGTRVALLDRDTFPRDKVCGEFLSYDALPLLERLGALDEIDRIAAPHLDSCRIVGSRRTYEFSFPHAARGVSRSFLDDLLLRIAEARGAVRLDGQTVTALEHDGVVCAAADAEALRIEARVIVGAWGRWGRFDQQLGRSFVRDRARRNFGFKRHYRRLQPSDAGKIDLYSFRDGYLGVNDVERGVTNICGLVHASRLEGHKGRWDSFVHTIREEEPRLEELYAAFEPAQETFLSSDPVIFRARSAVERGVFMIGDASGVIDPLTGNGMAMAAQSALLVAPLIMRLLQRGAERGAIEAEYRARHHAFFASRIAWSRRVALLLSRPRLLDAALAAGGRSAAGDFFLRKTRASYDEIARLTDGWFNGESSRSTTASVSSR